MIGYILTQLAQRLTTEQNHSDPEVAERARRRADQWQRLLEAMNLGQLEFGSRTPVADLPAWVTLEVLTGGFASGGALAAGPLQPHEQQKLEQLGLQERLELNGHFLSASGLKELRGLLASGNYQVEVAEEGAWLVLAWLEQHGHLEQAAELLEALLPFADRLRFYPVPRDQSSPLDGKVQLQTVAELRRELSRITPNGRILAQKETVEVWLPFYDEMLGLFQETVADGWPYRVFPPDWKERAQQLLSRYQVLRQAHRLCGLPERRKHSFAQLRLFLERDPATLSGREVGRLRLILQRSERKRGLPGSPSFLEARQRQKDQVQGPTHQQQAVQYAQNLSSQPQHVGLASLEGVPPALTSKAARSLRAPLEELVERGLVPSGEVLARILPQLVAQLRASEFSDRALGRLYASIYQAFRQRRSLLLLNLQSQVRLEELPWVAAVQPYRSGQSPSRLALKSLTTAALRAFPQTILPNKLIREMRALASDGQPSLLFTDELAADIFMGKFAEHYAQVARQAQDFLRGSLYQVYYRIEPGSFEDLAAVCAARAGVKLGAYKPAINGQILEQQQILTTHNLAALFQGLELELDTRELAGRCFRWICRRLQIPQGHWHDQLLTIKNCAYAWRQMIFFLSVGPQGNFFEWAGDHLSRQPEAFQSRFQPAWSGLLQAREGQPAEQPLLGWSQGKHWLRP
ncbi:hypothetical protein ABS71_16260 [bacterium SCN 62-11]|nr:hypothetical protein [Candidatus Eremiobacteraeota bacterium]ODT62083.1 MAG: hypothetical protein ABS71_16260 [bacterium SCN 62-11]